MDVFICKCDCCHKLFNGDDIVEKTHQVAGSLEKKSYFVSPCCHTWFEKVGEFANGETLIDSKGENNV